MRALAAGLLAAMLAACVSPQRDRRERTSPSSGAIVIAASVKGRVFPFYWRQHYAEELFFARLQPDGSFDPTLIPANYRHHDRLYVLDIPAGKYAPVGLSYFTGRTRQFAKIEPRMARKWAFEVKPGELAFGGVIQLGRISTDGWRQPARNWLKRMRSYLPPFKRALIDIEHEQPRFAKTAQLEIDTLRLAREDLAGTLWSETVETRLLALGNPPPELTDGLLRKKPLPRQKAETFTYIDTLGWGAPQKVSGGLQWQPGKERAWLSISLVPQPATEVLAELKQAGAPEDTHMSIEVLLSSRPVQAVTYTTYIYPEPALTGSAVVVFKTHAVIVPAAAGGSYKAQLRAEARVFDRFKPAFDQFLRYVAFEPPGKEPS